MNMVNYCWREISQISEGGKLHVFETRVSGFSITTLQPSRVPKPAERFSRAAGFSVCTGLSAVASGQAVIVRTGELIDNKKGHG